MTVEIPETIRKETQRDGWYLLHANCPADTCGKEQVLARYKKVKAC